MKIKALVKPTLLLAYLFLFIFAVRAQESPLSNGNTIYPICTSSKASTQVICSAYIVGFVSGAINQAQLNGEKPLFCLPEGVNNAQAVAVFTKYLTDHPEKRHFDTPSLIFIALGEAFPCPTSKK